MKSFPIIEQGSPSSLMQDIGLRPVPAALKKVAVITLGCAKNTVDSEVIAGTLNQQGFCLVSDPRAAAVAIVNTCGFLQSSVKESIDCILELSELKARGELKVLIVTGCLVERYRTDLAGAIPEVDHVVGINQIPQMAAMLRQDSFVTRPPESEPAFLYDDQMPRIVSSGAPYAYLKIADGCNRPCSFCIIPKLRGRFRSREVASLLREVESLAAQGVKEINLVAQDLTAFGSDCSRQERSSLARVLQAIDKLGAIPWVRLLYAYPTGIDEELLDCMRSLPSVCKYLDIPLQHVSEPVLQNMRRPLGRFSPRRLVEFIRSRAPELAIRTTFIVGFPGESEGDLEELERFVGSANFESVGVFTYSREEGTAAYGLPGQTDQKSKETRRRRIMRAQQQVARRRLESRLGTVEEVLFHGPHPESDLLLHGRTRFQAPEVDGMVIINDLAQRQEPLSLGDIVPVEFTEVAGYDLVGKALNGDRRANAA